MWGAMAAGLRGIMDFVRYFHPHFAVAIAARARMKRKVLPVAYQGLDRIPRLPPAFVRLLQRALMACETAIPVYPPLLAWLRAEAPDVMLVSPLVDGASDQVDVIKAARRCGVRTAVCIASWDNLTNKGVMRIEPDLVMVWNDAQRREAEEYHYMPPAKVVTTGAQLFDKWFTRQPTRARAAFCARVGLPDTAPFLLFTGSSSFISESRAEVAFVRRWIAALRNSGDPALARMNVLVRPHPYNCHAWDPDPLSDLPGAVFFPRSGYNPMDTENRADFFDSIHHSAGVVGINTSAMIEAAIIGRPVFSLLADEFSGTQEGLVHFHHLLPEHGGFVRVASTLDEHVQQLRRQLASPESARAEIDRFIGHFIRPHGVARPATPLFADAVERFGAAPAPRAGHVPLWSYGLRPLVMLGGAVAATATWAQRPQPVTWLGRRIQKQWWSTTKRVVRAVRLTAHRGAKQWRRLVPRPLRGR
jgi:hypothetical protein